MARNPILYLLAIILMTALSPVTASPASTVPAQPAIFDNVASLLQDRFYDRKFRAERLPALVNELRPPPGAPSDLKSQRLAAEKLLARVPASHLGLLSEESFRYLVAELAGQARPTVGFQLLRIKDDYFTAFVLEGGPAAVAGVLPWERVLSIDGVAPEKSSRLDWSQKDAHLPIDRDPPIHSILSGEDEEIDLVLERTPGESRALRLKTRPYSALLGTQASARLINVGDHVAGYVHFWFIHSTGVPELLRELLTGRFANADGLVLDLRGRGGNGVVVPDILQILAEWGRPIVALTDRQSRSAKDALAYEFRQRRLARLVGEPTAGAVIPASFAAVGEKTMLMFPSFTLGEYTEKLELKGGVKPDVFVERAGPYSGGNDPILDRGQQELADLIKARPKTPVPSLATDSGDVAASAAARPRPVGELPSLPDLIQKMTGALGGEKQIRAHTHRTLSGTGEMVGLPMKGAYLQKASAPNRSLVVMHLGDLVVRQGFDGEVAWSDTPMTGKQVVIGAAADMIRQQAQFYGPLDLVSGSKEITIVGFAPFDGKQCVELKLVGHGGTTSFLYVEAETWRVAGTKTNVETPLGPVETRSYSRNYRDLGGFITPTEIYIESSVQRQRITIDKVSFEEIPPSEYAPPAMK